MEIQISIYLCFLFVTIQGYYTMSLISLNLILTMVVICIIALFIWSLKRKKQVKNYLIGYKHIEQDFQELVSKDKGGYLGIHGVGGIGKTKLRQYLMEQTRMLYPHVYVVELTYDTAGERDSWSSEKTDKIEAREIDSEPDSGILSFFSVLLTVIEQIIQDHHKNLDLDNIFTHFNDAKNEYLELFKNKKNTLPMAVGNLNLEVRAENHSQIISNNIQFNEWLNSDEHRNNIISLVNALMKDIYTLPPVRKKWFWQKIIAPHLRLMIAIDGLDLIEENSHNIVTLIRTLKAHLGNTGILICLGRAEIKGLTDTYKLEGLSLNEVKTYLSNRQVGTELDQTKIFSVLKIKGDDGNNYVIPLTLALLTEYLKTFKNSIDEGIRNLEEASKGLGNIRDKEIHIFKEYLKRLRVVSSSDKFENSQKIWFRQLYTMVYYGSMLTRYKPVGLLKNVFERFPTGIHKLFSEQTNFEQIQNRFKSEVIIDRKTLELHPVLRTIARSMVWNSLSTDHEEEAKYKHIHESALEYYKQHYVNAPELIWHQIAVDPEIGLEQLFNSYLNTQIDNDMARSGVLYDLTQECKKRIVPKTPAYIWIILIEIADITFKQPLPPIIYSTTKLEEMHKECLSKLRNLRRSPLKKAQESSVLNYLRAFVVEKPAIPAEWGDRVWVLQRLGKITEAAESAICWADSHRIQDNYVQALEICHQAKNLCNSANPTPRDWQARLNLITGRIAFMQGYVTQAKDLLANTIQQFSRPENYELADALFWYGHSLIVLEKPSEAIKQLNQALNLYNGHKRMKANTLYLLGHIAQMQQNTNLALSKFQEAKNLVENDMSLLAAIEYGMGCIYSYKDDLTKARESFTRSLKAHESLENNQYNTGLIYEALGKLDESVENLEKALKIYKSLELHQSIANINKTLALIFKKRGQLDQAISHLNEAYKLYQQMGNKLHMTHCINYYGQIYYASKDYPASEKEYLKASEWYEQNKYWSDLAWIFCNLYLTYQAWDKESQTKQTIFIPNWDNKSQTKPVVFIPILMNNISYSSADLYTTVNIDTKQLAKDTITKIKLATSKVSDLTEQQKITKWVVDTKQLAKDTITKIKLAASKVSDLAEQQKIIKWVNENIEKLADKTSSEIF